MTNIFDLLPDVISPEDVNPLGLWGDYDGDSEDQANKKDPQRGSLSFPGEPGGESTNRKGSE